MAARTIPLRISGFALGMNNRRPDHQLDAGEDGRFLRSSVNADIAATGRLQRRRGYARVISGAECHSGWAAPSGAAAFYADGGSLYQLSGDPAAPTRALIRDGFAPQLPFSYAEAPEGGFYASNGAELGRIVGGVFEPLAPPPLSPQPFAVATSGGALPPGTYQVCFTQRFADGRESPATHPLQIEVPEDGRIEAFGLPAAFSPGVTSVVVYASPVNGDQIYRAAVLTEPATTFVLAVLPAAGPRCTTIGLTRMPPGNVVRFSNGRLLAADGRALFYSEPFAPGLTNPLKNFIVFPEPISVVEPVGGGVYVVAEATYWFLGDLGVAEARVVAPSRGVPRTGGQMPRPAGEQKSTGCFWMSERGLVTALPGGQLTFVQDDNVAVAPARAGATAFRERDGERQLVAGLFGTGPEHIAARSFMDAEVIRKETQL
ncbi:hypothetical protein [Caldimonas sp. KR1-144]|uniref:hypothetical protein n=1 Tax=Caldimonas sp. KR1-144 TaxID=3400911 RepID=UPI003C112F2C